MTEKFNTYAEYLVDKVGKTFKDGVSEKKENGNEGASDERKFIRWLSELSKKDIPVAGGKGANLAEMYNAKMPVPPAFVITAQAFGFFLQENRLKEKISSILAGINIEDTKHLDEIAVQIQKIITGAELPSGLKDSIIEAYANLNVDANVLKTASTDVLSILKSAREPCFVAVRSSATTEDLSTASFAGQQETFLNIKGNAELIDAVRRCFASLFTARAIYYRSKKGFAHEKSLIAVVVQKMINSDKSGVIFTVNPTTNSNEIVIEAVFGLGEGIVSGAIMPDSYTVNKASLKIETKSIGQKDILFTRNAEGRTIQQELNSSRRNLQVLTDSETKQLANYAMDIEQHYKHPQDIEFAVEAGQIYIVQTRPITTLDKKIEKIEIRADVLLNGIAASPGIASGVVRIVGSMQDLEKIKQGDVLVTKMTNPDMVVAMQKAIAIVTSEGGATAHAAIVSREMGIPCVTGTKRALEVLHEGQEITVDGSNGKVYEGRIAAQKKIEILPVVKTRTKIKVIIDLPDFAERAAETKASGIGLLRLEGIIANAKKHPLQYLRENKLNEYEELLFRGIKKIVSNFPDGESWIRASDIRTDEFQHLQGSPEIEANPMLGMHGIRFSLANPKLLETEFKAIKRVADENFKLGIMLPQIISIEEFEKTREMLENLGMPKKVKLGVMVETPAAVEIIEDLCGKGIEFISFGTNDLTQYTLAVDRGNEKVQFLYDEMHPAVLSQLARVIKICKQYGVETSICGQAASKKEMAEWLVRQGIDSISVNADAAHEISKVVAGVEKESEASQEGNGNDEKQEGQGEEVGHEKIIEKEMGEIIEKDMQESDEIPDEATEEVTEEPGLRGIAEESPEEMSKPEKLDIF